MQPPLTPETPQSLPPDLAEQFRQVISLLGHVTGEEQLRTKSKYLTVQEAAAYCRVAVQTIYNNRKYIARMPGVRKLLFTQEALDAWLAKRPTTRHKRK